MPPPVALVVRKVVALLGTEPRPRVGPPLQLMHRVLASLRASSSLLMDLPLLNPTSGRLRNAQRRVPCHPLPQTVQPSRPLHLLPLQTARHWRMRPPQARGRTACSTQLLLIHRSRRQPRIGKCCNTPSCSCCWMFASFPSVFCLFNHLLLLLTEVQFKYSSRASLASHEHRI